MKKSLSKVGISSVTNYTQGVLSSGAGSDKLSGSGKTVEDLLEEFDVEDPTAASIGVAAIVTAMTQSGSIAYVQKVVDQLNTLRASIGAKANQAEATVRNLATQIENLQEAESRIRDTDMADMTIDFQKNNILNNAATSMLAQANMQPQSVLQLLR